MTATRFDQTGSSIDLASARRDGRGALLVDATPARYGNVQDYARTAEYRPRSEVTSPRSLETWTGLPIVVGHQDVTASNVRDVSVGYVRSVRDRGDGWLAAELVLVDDAAIRAVEDGTLIELSVGYTVREDRTPGVVGGKSFDLIQRDITARHLAIGPKNWARAGEGARIR